MSDKQLMIGYITVGTVSGLLVAPALFFPPEIFAFPINRFQKSIVVPGVENVSHQ